VNQALTSPTFALEQRYKTAHFGEFLHVDLYRLEPKEAENLVSSSDDHTGIRCVEWADHLPARHLQEGIVIHLEDSGKRPGRNLSVTFRDLSIPAGAQIQNWWDDMQLPSLVRRHCDAVASAAARFGAAFVEGGQIVRMEALRAAGLLHDLFRFLDFQEGAAHLEEEIRPERSKRWEEIRAQYPRERHESACARFLMEQGFPEIGEIVRTHGLTLHIAERTTIEQKLLYYADKRIELDDLVTLEERLRDFRERYGTNGRVSAEAEEWYEEVRQTERDLFPRGPPF
jgi:HD superfamily phosphohydrolase YqeK